MSRTAARAELIEDRGEAAVSDDFFRCRPFLDAEGATHTLRIETDAEKLLAPLIVREIGDGPELDAISPYGYPGLAGPLKVDPATVDFSATGLVAAFIRHTLEEPPPLAGAGERNVVQIADPELPRKQRSSDRNQINKNRRNGYETRIAPGPETEPAERAGFLEAYEQTMRRAGAGERYLFGASYFDRILESPATWLALARAPDGSVAAASIAARSDGFLHYYLSGSVDSHLRDSPMKNVVAALVEHAAALGLPLNLGGGLSRGDRLEEFKRGFANREQPWRTSELVCDPAAYARLSAGHDAEGFFPAYRVPRD
jgi:Acetyltransferase (GNAT) domain